MPGREVLAHVLLPRSGAQVGAKARAGCGEAGDRRDQVVARGHLVRALKRRRPPCRRGVACTRLVQQRESPPGGTGVGGHEVGRPGRPVAVEVGPLDREQHLVGPSLLDTPLPARLAAAAAADPARRRAGHGGLRRLDDGERASDAHAAGLQVRREGMLLAEARCAADRGVVALHQEQQPLAPGRAHPDQRCGRERPRAAPGELDVTVTGCRSEWRQCGDDRGDLVGGERRPVGLDRVGAHPVDEEGLPPSGGRAIRHCAGERGPRRRAHVPPLPELPGQVRAVGGGVTGDEPPSQPGSASRAPAAQRCGGSVAQVRSTPVSDVNPSAACSAFSAGSTLEAAAPPRSRRPAPSPRQGSRAPPAGLEPATVCLEGSCTIHCATGAQVTTLVNAEHVTSFFVTRRRCGCRRGLPASTARPAWRRPAGTARPPSRNAAGSGVAICHAGGSTLGRRGRTGRRHGGRSSVG